jgi:hypothetical protein
VQGAQTTKRVARMERCEIRIAAYGLPCISLRSMRATSDRRDIAMSSKRRSNPDGAAGLDCFAFGSQ